MKIKAWKQQLVIVILCICILSYTLYHVASLFREDLTTFAAGVITETDSVSGNGYIFRDETVLYSDHRGVVNYLCDNGRKVSNGQALAEVHEGGTAIDRRRMALIDRQIALLEQSMEFSVEHADVAMLQQTVNDQYYMLSRTLAAGDTGELSEQISSMLVGLDRLSVVTEKDSAVAETLKNLKEQKETMLEKAGAAQVEHAPEGGYFYTDADGYETIFTEQALADLTPKSFYEMIASTTQKGAKGGQTAYGKLAKNSVWGFVVEIPFREAEYFEDGVTYAVQFTENNGLSLPMTLTRSIGVADQGTVLLVFSCDRLPDGFAFHRCQSVRIETDSVSGIYVPRKAVAYRGEFPGVYILRGSVVHFRYIEIVYEGSDYYLVDPRGGGEEGVIYLSENDLVIVGGKNLFDGRILE